MLVKQLDGAVKDCPRIARLLEQGGQRVIGRIKRTPWERSRQYCLELERQASRKANELARLVCSSKLLVLSGELSRCFSACTACHGENMSRLGQGMVFRCGLEKVPTSQVSP